MQDKNEVKVLRHEVTENTGQEEEGTKGINSWIRTDTSY
jgi:hypothetical protein